MNLSFYESSLLYMNLSFYESYLDESGRSEGTRRRSGARPNYLDQSFSNDEEFTVYVVFHTKKYKDFK